MLECVRGARTVVRARPPRAHTRPGPLLLLLALLHCVRVSACGGSLGAALVCARAPGLTERQRALCRQAPAAVAAIGEGLRMAYAECRAQLAGRRWNCSGVGDSQHFGHVMPIATKEAAFTYAITSAGVTHALSAACARGDLPACQCTAGRRRGAAAGEQFEWGGCGEGAYGARLARRFLDARELERDARALMNLHNNRVGRKVVKELVRRECKCHGVSGSCAMRTCWRALPPFRAAAAALRERYERARLVRPRDHHHLVLVRRHKQSAGVVRAPRKSELVYLQASPSYCERDDAAGSAGTHARLCNVTSRGEDGCESLCCGRGYNTQRRVLETKCRCRFHWCCRVTCDTCVARADTHVCK
ncbi:protein Wnt-2 isoform X2 [Helicoverpa armigera]|uniref:protein Wnt-2 isoform X2 n=1 Tax=Helicoverpa armigera TaxID=29058 RepID=UPI0021116F73|nr:protein Wnt-2 isoform X2 [Helicoverpa armigera]